MNMALLSAATAAAVFWVSNLNVTEQQKKIERLYEQQNDTDVFSGNKPPTIAGGWQYPTSVPGKGAFVDAELGQPTPGGEKPSPVAIITKGRACSGRKF